MQKLTQYTQQHPDAYLHEIAKYLDCSPSTVFYALKRLSITRKKKSTTYKEQDPTKVARYLTQLA